MIYPAHGWHATANYPFTWSHKELQFYLKLKISTKAELGLLKHFSTGLIFGNVFSSLLSLSLNFLPGIPNSFMFPLFANYTGCNITDMDCIPYLVLNAIWFEIHSQEMHDALWFRNTLMTKRFAFKLFCVFIKIKVLALLAVFGWARCH